MVVSTNPGFELLEPYKNKGKSVLCRCKKCGYEWKASPSYLLKEHIGCPKCLGHKKYTTEEFVNKMKHINPSIRLLEPYPTNNKTKILCVCNNCGNQFSMRPNNLLSGQGCPVCSRKKASQKMIKSNEEFVKELETINPNIIALNSYISSKTKILCRCKTCGNEWKATPNSLLHKYGCPKCSRVKMSQKNMKKVLCVETKKVYNSLKEAAEQTGHSSSLISMCCNGRREKAGGFHWRYVDN